MTAVPVFFILFYFFFCAVVTNLPKETLPYQNIWLNNKPNCFKPYWYAFALHTVALAAGTTHYLWYKNVNWEITQIKGKSWNRNTLKVCFIKPYTS